MEQSIDVAWFERMTFEWRKCDRKHQLALVFIQFVVAKEGKLGKLMENHKKHKFSQLNAKIFVDFYLESLLVHSERYVPLTQNTSQRLKPLNSRQLAQFSYSIECYGFIRSTAFVIN